MSPPSKILGTDARFARKHALFVNSIQLDEPGRSTVESPDVLVITTGFLHMDLKIGYIPLNALIDRAYP